MVYRPAFVKQLDGSRYAGLNCTCAVGAMALDRETLGRKTTTGGTVRIATGDTSGGTTQRQVAAALASAFNVDLDVEITIGTDEAFRRLDAGQAMMLAGQAAATRGSRFSASETFGGNHQWFVNERRAHGFSHEYLVFDPLADGRRAGIAQSPFWLPETILLDFARRLNVGGSHPVQLGPGRFYAVFTHHTAASLKLAFGGKAITPMLPKFIHVPAGQRANVRTGPNTASHITGTLKSGQAFAAFQVTTHGERLNGSGTWYGNINGTRWTHSSSF